MSRSRVASLVLSSLLVLAASACARLGPPAPVVQGTSAPPPRAVASTAVSAPSLRPVSESAIRQSTPGVVVVKSGESLYTLARRHNVPMRAVIDANGLEPPYQLYSGQRLTLPDVRSYEVQAGDTLSSIARRFGLGTSEMVRANAIAPPYHLRVGQVLVLPGGGAVPAADPLPAVAERQAPASAAPPVAVASAPLPDTVGRPSAPEPSSPSVGAAQAPDAPTVVASLPVPVTASPSVPDAAPPPPRGPVEAPSAGQPSLEPVAVAPRVETPDADDEPPPSRSGRGFIWPVRGTIVSDYGSKPGGLQNDGINIAAPRGAPIRAAEGGTVVYAGNELRGFGNLLLIRHRDGWITAYAHADELLVKRGASVRRGQMIARVGSSGSVASPQLHFEVRKGARHVNPRDVLAPQTAQAF